MNATAKNFDTIKPSERIAAATADRRSRRARRYRAMFHVPAAGFVIALCLLAYQNVQHRDAIVDDDSDMLDEQKPFFVQTCHMNGLSWDNYKQLEHLLTDREPA